MMATQQPYPAMRSNAGRSVAHTPSTPQQGFGSPQEPMAHFDRVRLARAVEARAESPHTQSLITLATLLPALERRRIAEALARTLPTEGLAPVVGRGTPATVVECFRALAETWRSETAALSSITEMALHPAYQQIIGLGPEVLPLLLQDLEREPEHWFWALKAITRADPVPPTAQGKVGEMAAHWLRWGKEQDLLR